MKKLISLKHLIFFSISSVLAGKNVPFTFPHGYFDVRKLQPFDAIYLNMMAQSNYEYGGTTLEELNALAEMRTKMPRPSSEPNIHRIFTTPKPKSDENVLQQQFNNVERVSPENDFPKPPPPPFTRRLHDEVENEERNPFEGIATRAPPGFQSFRGRSRSINPEFNHPKFLSRSSIVHASTKPPPSSTHVSIQDPAGGFEDIFVLPRARKLSEREFDHEDRLQGEWAKKNEAKLNYRKHSGQNLTTNEQQEVAASYKGIKEQLQNEKAVQSYRSHRDKIRVDSTREEENVGVDILDAILEDQIMESARKNSRMDGQDKQKLRPKVFQSEPPEFPTLTPNDPGSESIPLPSSLPIMTDDNSFSEIDITKPTIAQLPIPPTMWNTEWMIDFNK